MTAVFALDQVTKNYDAATTALDDVSLRVEPGHIIGLLGRNGSGKTTLIHHLAGLVLPTAGTCTTLGSDASELAPEQLERIGVVHQEHSYLEWMTVAQHLKYVASFYRSWDSKRQQLLLDQLELDPKRKVATLSPGDVQKLGIILAVCHHPELLLLDEPASALDPIARVRLLQFLLELIHEDQSTIVISSHILHDVEQVIDWVICLDRGRVCVDAGLDSLQERYARWQVTRADGELPEHFDEDFVLEQQGNGAQAQLVVCDGAAHEADFAARHHAEIKSQPLNLEQIFPHLLEDKS
jgi:ABC-2 type transport system ATP-binding protein